MDMFPEDTNVLNTACCYSLWLMNHLFMFMFWTDIVVMLKVTTSCIAIFFSYDDEEMARQTVLMSKPNRVLANQSSE